jgi:hypothetical protein
MFLKERAKHPPQCYRAYDAVRLCLLQRIDPHTCGKVMEAYRPCAREVHKMKLQRVMEQEEERRRILAAKTKVLHPADAAAAAAAAGGGGQQRQ